MVSGLVAAGVIAACAALVSDPGGDDAIVSDAMVVGGALLVALPAGVLAGILARLAARARRGEPGGLLLVVVTVVLDLGVLWALAAAAIEPALWWLVVLAALAVPANVALRARRART